MARSSPAVATFPGTNGPIAFTTTRDANLEIYRMNPDGSNQENLTMNPAGDFFAAWSPDGTKLVFSAVGRGATDPDIYVMNADGSGVLQVTTEPGSDDGFPAWSPDGDRIAFSSTRAMNGGSDIWVVNEDGTNPVRLTEDPGQDEAPNWAPNGQKIAFHSDRTGDEEIWDMNPDGSAERRLTVSAGPDRNPDYSPDSTLIAFHSVRDGDFDIWVMDADGTSPDNRSDTPAFPDTDPAWSPDGNLIAFQSNRDGDFDIWVMNADGSGQADLTANPAADLHPDWSPLDRNGGLTPRMTGGGAVVDGLTAVSHGFELRCDRSEMSNLRVNWGPGNQFDLEDVFQATCRDDPQIEQQPPTAGFDTHQGSGTGTCNGETAFVRWTLTDGGEPGTADTADLFIAGGADGCVLNVEGGLVAGNHQAIGFP